MCSLYGRGPNLRLARRSHHHLRVASGSPKLAAEVIAPSEAGCRKETAGAAADSLVLTTPGLAPRSSGCSTLALALRRAPATSVE